MKEITIVTAFFDIGRTNFKDIPRSNEKYLEYFKFWARIKNNLIVYTDSEMAKNVKKIRKDYGLESNTKVIIIDDISKIEPNILNRMKDVEKSKYFRSFRYKEDATENSAIYNYVMLLKSWCLIDAVKQGYTASQVAWLDFGYNHGGKVFSNSLDFNYEWKYSFGDKITVFSIKEDDNKPILFKVQSLEDNFMGSPFICPSKLTERLWNINKEVMNNLLDIGLMDDDQLIMLMSYRKNPELFNIIKSDWFMPLKEYGGSHLTIKNIYTKSSIKDKILYKYRVNKRNKRYINSFKKVFLKDYLD